MGLDNLKVIVFDLEYSTRKHCFYKLIRIPDYTLWPFWVDTHVSPPFKKKSDGTIIDSRGSKISCYPEVPDILKNLDEQGFTLAVASRTSEIKGARQLIELFGWDKYFSYKEIFPGKKVCHFNKIKSQSQVDYCDMIFFDDEQRNIRDVSALGVTSILVTRGVCKSVIEEGKKLFEQKRR